jgi:hypothetical protein
MARSMRSCIRRRTNCVGATRVYGLVGLLRALGRLENERVGAILCEGDIQIAQVIYGSIHLPFERLITMRVFLVSLTAVAIIAVGAAVVLDTFQMPASVAFSTSAVRL